MARTVGVYMHLQLARLKIGSQIINRITGWKILKFFSHAMMRMGKIFSPFFVETMLFSHLNATNV